MAFFQKLQTCDDFHLSDVEALFFSIFTQKPPDSSSAQLHLQALKHLKSKKIA